MSTQYKKFIFEDETPPIYFRPGTSDEIIINELIVKRKGYMFIHADPKLVFDIGSNIGVAALVMSNVYPNAVIHCFEPEAENFKLLEMNTAHLKERVVLYNVGLSNCAKKTTLYSSNDGTNHGGFSVEQDPSRNAMPHSEITIHRMRDYIEELGCPEILKIDCEGAEFDILSDVPDLNKVLWIAGELHDVKSWELLALIHKTHEINVAHPFGAKVWEFAAGNRAELFHNIAAPRKGPTLAAVPPN